MAIARKKILFIDDDQFIRKIYQSDLTARGFEVITAEDGEIGLRKVETDQPDLVICDLIMPQKNGFEVLEELQKSGFSAKVPVIVHSNLAQDADKERALHLGAREYLLKDETTFDAMFEAVSRYLSVPVES